MAVTGTDPFRVARRGGYEREDVDAYVAQLERRIAELEAQLRSAASPEDAVRHALEHVGDEVAAILHRAHEGAEHITTTAEREASAERAAAAREASEVTARAEERVRELDLDADRIWAERERLLADIHELSQRLADLATASAARFPSEVVPAATGPVPPLGANGGEPVQAGSSADGPDRGNAAA